MQRIKAAYLFSEKQKKNLKQKFVTNHKCILVYDIFKTEERRMEERSGRTRSVEWKVERRGGEGEKTEKRKKWQLIFLFHI